MNVSPSDIDKAIEYLVPENELEFQFLQNPDFQKGLFWGMPRYGHPEGKVVYHIREVLDNIDKLPISALQRRQLRIVTFVHDTFKYREHRGTPRDWTKHHAVLAKLFLENYIDDQLLLDLTEFHDDAYYVWRTKFQLQDKQLAATRLEELYKRFDKNMQLYYLFFKCDTCTGDKNPAPLKWFEETIQGITIVSL